MIHGYIAFRQTKQSTFGLSKICGYTDMCDNEIPKIQAFNFRKLQQESTVLNERDILNVGKNAWILSWLQWLVRPLMQSALQVKIHDTKYKVWNAKYEEQNTKDKVWNTKYKTKNTKLKINGVNTLLIAMARTSAGAVSSAGQNTKYKIQSMKYKIQDKSSPRSLAWLVSSSFP